MAGSATFEPARRDSDRTAAEPGPSQPQGSTPARSRRPVGRRLRPSLVPVPGAAAPGVVMRDVLASPGQPLAAPLRREMEERLSADFSDVRVHTGAAARGSAAEVGARAYTLGSHVVIGDGGADKHTLAHELAHVIQQRTGPVAGTDHGTGLRLSDPSDPFERAAESAAARAMSASAPRPRATSPQAASAGVAAREVVQREFVRQPVGEDEEEEWLDTDTGVVYRTLRYLSGRRVQVTPVEDRDKHPELELRHVPSSDSWEVIRTVRNPAEKNLKRSRYEMEEEEKEEVEDGLDSDEMEIDSDSDESEQAEPKHPLAYPGPAAPTFAEQAEQQWVDRGLRLARLSTAFTVQVDVAPVSQGLLTGRATRTIRYSPDQVVATHITVGNKDRPATYLKPKTGKSGIPQGRHTVAWSFLRRSFAAMTGMSVRQILLHLEARLTQTIPLIQSMEGLELLRLNWVTEKPSKIVSIISQLAEEQTTLPVERWQATVSEAIRYYAQLYHLSLGATFTGRSASRDESGGLRFLMGYEVGLRVTASPSEKAAAEATDAAAKLLDVQQTMRPEAYAFAVAHWIDLLGEVYPAVMHHHGSQIIREIVNKPLAPTYRKVIPAEESDPVHQFTVGDLLKHFHYAVPADFALRPEREELKATGIDRYADVYGGSSEFIASVALGVRPHGKGQTLNVMEVPGLPASHMVQALSPDQVLVDKVTVSDMDRPDTQFGTSQQSHTVAWTLVRAELASFAGKPLTDLLTFLTAQFGTLAGDVNEEGSVLVKHAKDQLMALSRQRWPIHIWQRNTSLLVKWYAHAHQLGRSTTYYDPRSHGAFGHGEASHMRVLMANEASAAEDRVLVNPEERVIEAAVKLLDVYSGLDDTQIRRAVVKWKTSLQRTFPVLMTEMGSEILKAAGKLNIGTKKQQVALSTRVPSADLTMGT